ncbi:transglutaminase-like domain-containing protein [Mycoplasma sp. Ms02]|uniref:transglutaminase-like domain-containing protein n=1 Tax=Mycoplasma sp. Ms02 TaxID=353851 RepID=UPI001C8A4ADE|nr:transglutaminase-like domain-containing protein [Mycoplasma sp. Ms02]QZE12455.1 transglutaminase-like domain-containing protein [Mycoplasma sp. Ms02]
MRTKKLPFLIASSIGTLGFVSFLLSCSSQEIKKENTKNDNFKTPQNDQPEIAKEPEIVEDQKNSETEAAQQRNSLEIFEDLENIALSDQFFNLLLENEDLSVQQVIQVFNVKLDSNHISDALKSKISQEKNHNFLFNAFKNNFESDLALLSSKSQIQIQISKLLSSKVIASKIPWLKELLQIKANWNASKKDSSFVLSLNDFPEASINYQRTGISHTEINGTNLITSLIKDLKDVISIYKIVRKAVLEDLAFEDKNQQEAFLNWKQSVENLSFKEALTSFNYLELTSWLERKKYESTLSSEIESPAFEIYSKPDLAEYKKDFLSKAIEAKKAGITFNANNPVKQYFLDHLIKMYEFYKTDDHLYLQAEQRLKFLIDKYQNNYNEVVLVQWGIDDNDQWSLYPTKYLSSKYMTLRMTDELIASFLKNYDHDKKYIYKGEPIQLISEENIEALNLLTKFKSPEAQKFIKDSYNFTTSTWSYLSNVRNQNDYREYLQKSLNEELLVEDKDFNDIQTFSERYPEYASKYFFNYTGEIDPNVEYHYETVEKEFTKSKKPVYTNVIYKNVDYDKYALAFSAFPQEGNGILVDRTDYDSFFANLYFDKPNYFVDKLLRPDWEVQINPIKINDASSKVITSFNQYTYQNGRSVKLKDRIVIKEHNLSQPTSLDLSNYYVQNSQYPIPLYLNWIAKWKEILPKIINPQWTEKQKIEAVSYYILNNTTYLSGLNTDGNLYNFNSEGNGFYSPFAIFGKDKQLQCVGYSSNLSLALTLLNIPVRIVGGELLQDGFATTQAGGHAWNEVYLDGRWKIVDLTNLDNQDHIEEIDLLQEELTQEELADYILNKEANMDQLIQERNDRNDLRPDISNYMDIIFKYKNPSPYEYKGISEYFTKNQSQQPSWNEWIKIRKVVDGV